MYVEGGGVGGGGGGCFGAFEDTCYMYGTKDTQRARPYAAVKVVAGENAGERHENSGGSGLT